MNAAMHEDIREYLLHDAGTIGTPEPLNIFAQPFALIKPTDGIENTAARQQALAHVAGQRLRKGVIAELLALLGQFLHPEVLEVGDAEAGGRIGGEGLP